MAYIMSPCNVFSNCSSHHIIWHIYIMPPCNIFSNCWCHHISRSEVFFAPEKLLDTRRVSHTLCPRVVQNAQQPVFSSLALSDAVKATSTLEDIQGSRLEFKRISHFSLTVLNKPGSQVLCARLVEFISKWSSVQKVSSLLCRL